MTFESINASSVCVLGVIGCTAMCSAHPPKYHGTRPVMTVGAVLRVTVVDVPYVIVVACDRVVGSLRASRDV